MIFWLILKYNMEKNIVFERIKIFVGGILRSICMWTWALFLGNSTFSSLLSFGIFIKRILIKKISVKQCVFIFLQSVFIWRTLPLWHKKLIPNLGVLWKRFNSWLLLYLKLTPSIFICSPDDSPSKTMKNPFYFSFCSLNIQFFAFSSSPFFSIGYCFRGWSKINLKVCDTINCLNNNSINTFCLISWEGKMVWHWNFVHR